MNEKPKPSNALIQQKRGVAELLNGERARQEIAKVLPKHLTPERMTRVALTATLKTPALLNCSPESLMNALLVCSQAGLEPDGRLAHLIPFGNQVQVIFDYKGLVTLALRNGAESVFAEKVCEHDVFEAVVENGEKRITHKANWAKPRGTPVCYYAICKRKGEVDWEVMTVEEVEDIRKRSRAADKGPWVTDFDEMAKKTVLRRMSKRWDLLPEIRDVINADDDTPPPFNQVTVAKPVFDTPRQVAAPKPEPEQTEPQAEAPQPEPENQDADLGPQAQAPAAEPPAQMNPLKALRGLLRAARPVVKEGDLLAYLAANGTTDGSIGTLEELLVTQPATVKLMVDDWSELLVRFGEWKGGE